MSEKKHSEKERRIYYQDIVYSVCNSLDRIFGTHVVCGTVDEPHREVQDLMRILEGVPVSAKLIQQAPQRVKDSILSRAADVVLDELEER